MMSPVTRQPEENPFFSLPNPPTPSRTEEVCCDCGSECCFSVCVDSMCGCGIGGAAGILLEIASVGTIASTDFPLGLCCAFGFTCCWVNLMAQVIKKRRRLDHAYHQDLLTYNKQLHDRVIMLSRQSDKFDSNQSQCIVSQPLNDLMPMVDPCVDNSVQHSACEPPVKRHLFNNSLALALEHNRLRPSQVPDGASGMNNV